MNQYKVVGNYQIFLNQKLGLGSTAEVFIGERKTDKLKVAVKVISKQFINSRDKYIKELFKKRIKNEIAIQQSLKHPNIIQLFDVQETNNSIYFFMELADCTLDQYYSKNKIKEEELKKIMRQVVEAFCYMTQFEVVNQFQNDQVYKGVCHLDLKPQNILMIGNSIKISDFGLSAALQFKEDEQLLQSLEQNENLVHHRDYLGQGSLLYMSIEQLNYQQTSNLEILDVWSAGVIFYEIAFGKHPYYDANSNLKNPLQIGQLLIDKEIEFPKLEFDESFYDLLKGMLNKNHKERLLWQQCKEHPFLK